PGMRVANALPGALATPGALLLGDVIEAIGGLDVPLGVVDSPAAAKSAWELLDRGEPIVVVLTASSPAKLFEHEPPRDRPWWKLVVWLHSDEVTDAARPAPPPGVSVEQRIWLAAPEAASFVAHSCPQGRFHVDQGVFAEIESGMLTLTRTAGD